MKSSLAQVSGQYLKPSVVRVRSGDTVKVHQRIKEGNKERIQLFEGLVIRVDRSNSLTYRITVRRISSGVGVEKGFMMHSPSLEKVEVIKRSQVRRNYLSYVRNLTGKSLRLKGQTFNQAEVNQPKPQKTDEQVVATAAKPEAKPKADPQTEPPQPASKATKAQTKKSPAPKVAEKPLESGKSPAKETKPKPKTD